MKGKRKNKDEYDKISGIFEKYMYSNTLISKPQQVQTYRTQLQSINLQNCMELQNNL